MANPSFTSLKSDFVALLKGNFRVIGQQSQIRLREQLDVAWIDNVKEGDSICSLRA